MLRALTQAESQGVAMDSGLLFGLDIATADAVFGAGPASFLSRLEAGHPDLLREPFRSMFFRATQIAKCACFCVENCLSFPLEALKSSFPRSHPFFFSAVRLLEASGREDFRRRKSFISLDFDSLASDPFASSPDLPDSFGRFRAVSDGGSEWKSMESDFRSAGCSLMAERAVLMASEFSEGEFGLRPLSMRRAFLVLGRKAGLWGSARRLFPVAVPAVSLPLPGWAEDVVRASESSMSGFPMFDHHIVLFFSETPEPQFLPPSGLVILGERDGRFHFLESD